MDKAEFKLVTEEHSPAKSQDSYGYDRYVFVSSRDATLDEFTTFLKEHNFKISPKRAWYHDYSDIKGSGKNWTYWWVSASTN